MSSRLRPHRSRKRSDDSNGSTTASVGSDDQAILQFTAIASWFNYINRVADALGIGRE
jgi:alkylhydroperoxidase family enzyme